MNKRINEVSGRPIGEYLSRDISDFQRVSRTLFECFSSLATGATLNSQQLQQIQLPIDQISNNATPNMVLQLMNHLIDVDKIYQNTLKKLEKHQKIQKEITEIQKEIEEKDKLISTLALNLKDIESFLENELSQDNVNINNGNASDGIVNEVLIDLKQPDDAASMDNIVNREVSPEDLISYAHKISGTTSAPFGYQPNAPLASLFKPPAPQDEMMRSSVLFTKPPPHVLKYYGLAEIDVTTPTMAANISSPFSIGGNVGDVTTPTSKEQEDQQQQQQQQQPQQQLSQSQQSQQQTESELQPIQSILQPPQQLNIDLDLNPDLDSSGDDDDEDDDDEESEEVEWD
ncbi:hypothetical protein DDB_G0292608 [Dictyostelium discoideum AX4]|uniref:Putative mediator of RNA polymerase II transcription subunit 4 n=1 Tax=Dictyostelium discoideum TaxID=44689 RepID=MED4_DICDI|nr:hypothetical protein DDB_G0292608 [Dictyostelium discoideum AX4]Q54D00.1 RecName: Full=Putative mediator of RNA polymerase II transcription subunit 4; AltName: Full=Putative mediator complex subunit 4 [Dictyostelium discoideum]EAL61107.1 hypothetical protein DDB_G0292608 [Dictyostelium discoideum AX4]|eukprot:XP_629520.1 hypothetical protein DDB_G0292608 [Dictyostelium discoideum AX4]